MHCGRLEEIIDMVEISDIIVAIENKDHFVLDPFIKKGDFVKMTNGQPLRYVGGFTAVFPVIISNEKWAFRCWHAEMGNVRRRFEKIAKAISASNAKYLCDFVYTDEGIIVKGKRYPTTRMRWVEGQTIKDYICANAYNSEKLNALAHRFLEMVQDMHKYGFAHGDLQHGNIIIDKFGEPYLVDYDSFYCPELKGERDIITGLVDYQHPSRKTNILSNEKLDYFSELIIYLSILAIAEQPSLVQTYHVADSERMLFAASDYRDLRNSAIYADLQQLSLSIQQLLNILCVYLSKQTLDELLPFDVLLDQLTKEPEIKQFQCSNDVLLKGDKVVVTWEVENFTKILLNGKDVINQSSFTEQADKQREYKLEVFNYQKHTSRSIVISIFPRPTISFNASKQKLHAGKGEKVEISWLVENADNVNLLLPDGTKSTFKLKDSIVLSPTDTSTYILQVTALDKRTTIDTPITINVYPIARVEFSSDKMYVFPSIPFTLFWQVQHAKRITLNGKVVKARDSMVYEQGVEKDTTYTLRVTDEFGTKDYPLSIKMLPIPQIKTILVPMPQINENINITIKVPTPTLNVNFPLPRFREMELLDLKKYDIHIETNRVQPVQMITPCLELKDSTFFERMYNKLNTLLKRNNNGIK